MAAKKKGKTSRKAAKAAPAKPGFVNAAHQIWLAGLGALARAQQEGPKLFETLVQEGSAVHERQRDNATQFVQDKLDGLRDAVEARVEGVRGKASETLENLEQIFQTRVKKALQQLGMPTSEEIRALSRKVNELNRSVQALTSAEPRKTGKPGAAAADDVAVI